METRGRKSVAELSVVPVLPGQRPDPPADLSDAEARCWRTVVLTKPAEWWKADTEMLLKAYCRAAIQHDVISAAINAIPARRLRNRDGWAMYERMRRSQVAASGEVAQLATKMRLTQQSRYTAQSAATADRKATSRRPWESKHGR